MNNLTVEGDNDLIAACESQWLHLSSKRTDSDTDFVDDSSIFDLVDVVKANGTIINARLTYINNGYKETIDRNSNRKRMINFYFDVFKLVA